MGSVTRSAIRVTFSSGWIRRQVKTAERAPGVNSAGKGCAMRCDAVGVEIFKLRVRDGSHPSRAWMGHPRIYSG